MAGPRRLRVALAAAITVAIGAALLLREEGPVRGPERLAPAPAPPRAATPPSPALLPPPAPAPAEPGAAASPLPPEAALVEGRVTSLETGLGVPGAEVTFSRGGAAASARTGADGRFRFEAPVEGRWLLAAVIAAGFLPFAPEWGHSPVAVEVRAGQRVASVEVRLAPARLLVATVLGPDGAPVAGAEVRLVGARAEAALVAIEDRFTTDAAGEVRLSAPRGAVVEARKAGLAPGRAVIDVAATVERRLTVRLRAASAQEAAPGRVGGRVVERGTGAPVAGALVVAEREQRSGDHLPAGQALTGIDGAFALAELAPGSYRLTASAEGRARAVLTRVAPGTSGAVLEVGPGGRLRGCVKDATSGEPVTAFTVTVIERQPPEARGPELDRVFLDPSGCFALDDLAPGPAALRVTAPGFTPSPRLAVEVPASGEATADVRLGRGRRVRGVVLDAERRTPVSGAHVALEWANEAGAAVGAAEEAWTDGQGRFELAGLPPRFSLEVTAPGHHVRIAGGLEAPPGDAPGEVVVTVTPAAPGEEPRREITGIGIAIAPRDDVLVVTAVMAGAGAAAAGLVKGDAIVRVDGIPVAELGFAGAANAIRGPEGTAVRLTLRRGEGTVDLWITRGVVRG